jgi:hypothetical protein
LISLTNTTSVINDLVNNACCCTTWHKITGFGPATSLKPHRVDGVGGDGAAAGIDEWRRTTLPEIEEKAIRYLRLRLGIVAAQSRFGFSSASIEKFAETCRHACWIGEHLGSHDTQTTSLRAFKAVQEYAFGKRGVLDLGAFGVCTGLRAKLMQ